MQLWVKAQLKLLGKQNKTTQKTLKITNKQTKKPQNEKKPTLPTHYRTQPPKPPPDLQVIPNQSQGLYLWEDGKQEGSQVCSLKKEFYCYN